MHHHGGEDLGHHVSNRCRVNAANQIRMTMLAGLFSVIAVLVAFSANSQEQVTELKLLMGDVSLNKLPFVLAGFHADRVASLDERLSDRFRFLA